MDAETNTLEREAFEGVCFWLLYSTTIFPVIPLTR